MDGDTSSYLFYTHTHTHTHTCARALSQLPANAQTQSSCVFSVCSPAHPLRPYTPNLHPCIPSIADTGAKGHVTY